MKWVREIFANETVQRIVKFGLVGIVNTAFGYALFAALIYVGIAPQPALAIAFFVGVIWNYLTHARIVFGTEGFKRLPAYAVSYFLIYFMNRLGLAWLLGAGLHPLLAQALMLPIIAVISFFVISKALTGHVPLFGGTPKSS